MKVVDLFKQVDAFTLRLEQMLSKLEMLDVCKGLRMDHVCVRLSQADQVQELERDLLVLAQCISTAQIAGRLIHIFELSEPLQIGQWFTRGVELPYPKPAQSYRNDWEHVEFVLPEAENNMRSLREAFDRRFPHLSNSKFCQLYQRKDSEPNAAGDQIPNPTIAIMLGGVTAKFHPRSIQEVVGYTETSM